MSRRKKGNVVNGWLVLDKPHGMTSTRCQPWAIVATVL